MTSEVSIVERRKTHAGSHEVWCRIRHNGFEYPDGQPRPCTCDPVAFWRSMSVPDAMTLAEAAPRTYVDPADRCGVIAREIARLTAERDEAVDALVLAETWAQEQANVTRRMVNEALDGDEEPGGYLVLTGGAKKRAYQRVADHIGALSQALLKNRKARQ